MKNLIFLLVFLITFCVYTQEERSMQMGQTTMEELQMTSYGKDPSAPAVVLYDEVSYYYSDYKKKIFNRDIIHALKFFQTKACQKELRPTR